MNLRTSTPAISSTKSYATAPEQDDLLQLLDTVDESFPGSGVLAGSPTGTEEAVLPLDVELDIEKAQKLMSRFARIRRELDADDSD